MKFLPIKTRQLLPPKENIYKILDKHLPKLKEGDVLLIASKILALHQGRCIKVSDVEKSALIKKEADYLLPKHKIKGSDIILTIKDSTLIPSAGIDESNGNGYYILWPKNTNQLCKKICGYLKKKFKIKKLAVIATDSHTTPLRWGTMGISIGFFGIEPNLVMIASWKEKLGIIIESHEISDAMKKIFELAWIGAQSLNKKL
jgi:F420-0:gamma-glutamyl ligase